MPTTLDSIRLCQCFEANRTDLARYISDTRVQRPTKGFTTEPEQFLAFDLETSCLQRWLDLNA